MKTLAVLHLADLYRDQRMILPSRADWSKIPRILAGTWPETIPSRVVLGSGADLGDGLAWLATQKDADHLVIDTEYIPSTGAMLMVGFMARRGPEIETVQFTDWPRMPAWFVQSAGIELRDLVGRVPCVFQNAVADLPILEQALGVRYQDFRQIEDVMLLHAVLWSEMPHDLEFLASLYSRHPKLKHLMATDMALYNAGDLWATDDAWMALAREGAADPDALSIYRSQSLRLIPIVMESNARGIRVAADRVQTAAAEYAGKMADASRIGRAWCGWPINVGSDDQLKRVLYAGEGMPVQTHKKTRKPTIDTDAIATLRAAAPNPPDPDQEEEEGLSAGYILGRITDGAHPLLEARVLYAGAMQADSHYIRPCALALTKDGRIYPRTLIHSQASGRHSIVDPPMQQIPADLRDIVCPDPGEVWVKWDWSNIETWLLAELAQDRPLLAAREAGWDTHVINYCDMFGVPLPLNLVDPHTSPECAEWRAQIGWAGKDDVRRVFAKRGVYRTHYRGDTRRAGDIPGAAKLGLNAAKASQALQRYLASHPASVEFWRASDATVRATGLTRTFMGRPRRLLGSGDARFREGTNHQLQGGVADILNHTLCSIKEALPATRVVWTAHDAGVIGMPAASLAENLSMLKRIVERAWTIGGRAVTFPADYKIIQGDHP